MIKLLRIFIYAVVIIPTKDLWLLLVLPITVFAPFLFAIVLWAQHGNYKISTTAKEEYLKCIPLYTTIKTIKQIWRD